MKKLILLSLFFFCSATYGAEVVGGGGRVTVREEDGDPSGLARVIRFPNGAVTANGGGDYSVSIAAGAATAFNDIGDTTGNGAVALGHTNIWTFSLDGSRALTINSSDADNAADTTLLTLSFNDSGDTNSIFLEMIDDVDGTPVSVYKFSATGFSSTVSGTFGTGNGQIDIGTAGVRLTSDGDGALTLLGLGDGSDEDLTINLDDTANTAVFSSSTGLNLLDLGTIGIDLDSATLRVPNGTADATLATAGDFHFNTTDEQISFHSAADGEISGEAALSLIQHRSWTFDPDAVCDGAVDRLFLMTVGDQAPEGIRIVEWKVSFEADPTTEVDLDLKYADAFIGVANSAVIDVLDTTAGVSSEDTNANINGGAAVANGKVIYLEFGTAYTETGHQIIFEMWFYAEED